MGILVANYYLLDLNLTFLYSASKNLVDHILENPGINLGPQIEKSIWDQSGIQSGEKASRIEVTSSNVA